MLLLFFYELHKGISSSVTPNSSAIVCSPCVSLDGEGILGDDVSDGSVCCGKVSDASFIFGIDCGVASSCTSSSMRGS